MTVAWQAGGGLGRLLPMPVWVTVSLRAGGQINEYLYVKGALENMFDKSYREHGSGINAPGVNVLVSLETRF